MGNSFTIHNLDPVTAKMLRSRAESEGLSLNRMVKKLLAQALGVIPPDTRAREREFEEFCGIWSAEEAQEFENAVSDLGQVDPGDWSVLEVRREGVKRPSHESSHVRILPLRGRG